MWTREIAPSRKYTASSSFACAAITRGNADCARRNIRNESESLSKHNEGIKLLLQRGFAVEAHTYTISLTNDYNLALIECRLSGVFTLRRCSAAPGGGQFGDDRDFSRGLRWPAIPFGGLAFLTLDNWNLGSLHGTPVTVHARQNLVALAQVERRKRFQRYRHLGRRLMRPHTLAETFSMSCARLPRGLETLNQQKQRDRAKCQPCDHTEAIHE